MYGVYMMKPPHTRSVFLDVLKAVAITLVLVGHAMQFGSGAHCFIYSDFFDNVVFKTIYSFHMPLFMLISGYLFRSSVQRHSPRENLVSRFTSLLVPIMLWSIIPYIIRIVSGDERGVFLIVRAYFTTCIGNFWFLWAVFYCSLIVLAVNKFCRDNVLVYIVIAVIMLFTPDLNRLQLYKFMYGYFVVGYMWAKSGKRVTNANIVKLSAAFLAMGAIYLGMFRLYGRDCYIYTTGFSLIGKDMLRQFGIDVFRFVVGIVGSCVVILFAAVLAYIAKHVNIFGVICGKLAGFFGDVGKNTLGIYLVSTLIFTYIIKPLAWGLYGIDYVMTAIQTAAVMIVSLAVIWLIRRILVIGRWLLGGR